MEPYEAINMVEVVLRRLIQAVMGEGWKADRSIDLARLEQKYEEEVASRRGLIASDDLLQYTEFTQLKQIIDNSWESFSAALGKKKYFDTYMDRLTAFRNPTMHSRQLFGFERDLVAGIAGEIRQMTAIYRSSGKGQDMNYYPSIEVVSDNFGRSAKTTSAHNRMPINVGDVVTFTCHATDPQDRQLTWSANVAVGGTVLPKLLGSEVTFTWTVEEANVGYMVGVWFRVTSDGKYHKWSDYDDESSLFFEVIPPDFAG